MFFKRIHEFLIRESHCHFFCLPVNKMIENDSENWNLLGGNINGALRFSNNLSQVYGERP